MVTDNDWQLIDRSLRTVEGLEKVAVVLSINHEFRRQFGIRYYGISSRPAIFEFAL